MFPERWVMGFAKGSTHPSGLRRRKFCPRNLFLKFRKFRLPTDPNHFHIHHCPVPSEGLWPTSSTWGGMRWTRLVPLTMALTRTAKSCRSDAPMLASSLREDAQMTVSNKPGHRGEHEVSRKTIARGMSDCLR